ncbi:MAG: hypothetical protein ACLU6W_02885 [Lachnospiraceae bacterium]|nr:hypothetical protein [Candidatus Fimimorpha excrementavium]
MSGPYDDMIEMPHPVSRNHPPMSMEDRAAQFLPFAALSGFGNVIRETARRTEKRPMLSESCQEDLKRKLDILGESIFRHPEVSITYFLPDPQKEGGSHVTAAGKIKRIDDIRHRICLEDGTLIPFSAILEIESEFLDKWDL